MDITDSFDLLGISAELRIKLIERMTEPHRVYHTVKHVKDLLAHYDGSDPNIVAAAWYHDIVYDPRASDNEERSEQVMREELADNQRVDIEQVSIMILDTKTHKPQNEQSALFSDLDMSILAADPESYKAYSLSIRHEYKHVGQSAFAEGRRAFLESVLSKDRIFFTDDFSHLEAQARVNLTNELAEVFKKI